MYTIVNWTRADSKCRSVRPLANRTLHKSSQITQEVWSWTVQTHLYKLNTDWWKFVYNVLALKRRAAVTDVLMLVPMYVLKIITIRVVIVVDDCKFNSAALGKTLETKQSGNWDCISDLLRFLFSYWCCCLGLLGTTLFHSLVHYWNSVIRLVNTNKSKRSYISSLGWVVVNVVVLR